MSAIVPVTTKRFLLPLKVKPLAAVKPVVVHVFANGKIVEEGGPELADKLEEKGYAEYITA